jgi:hypothetical protein
VRPDHESGEDDDVGRQARRQLAAQAEADGAVGKQDHCQRESEHHKLSPPTPAWHRDYVVVGRDRHPAPCARHEAGTFGFGGTVTVGVFLARLPFGGFGAGGLAYAAVHASSAFWACVQV